MKKTKLHSMACAAIIAATMVVQIIFPSVALAIETTETTDTDVAAETTVASEDDDSASDVVITSSADGDEIVITPVETEEDLEATESEEPSSTDEEISSETNTDPTFWEDEEVADETEETDESEATLTATDTPTATPTATVTPTATPTPTTVPVEYVEFDHYYSDVDVSNIHTSELLVMTSDPEVFTRSTTVVSNYDDVYIIAFDSVEMARFAFSYYYDRVEYITDLSDVASIAEDNEDSDEPLEEDVRNIPDEEVIVEETQDYVDDEPTVESETVVDTVSEEQEPDVADLSDLNNGNDAIANLNDIDTVHNDYSGYIALIDTGANAHANFTVLGGDTFDHSGHGTDMFGYIRSENPQAQVVSIKVSEDGTASAADVYAGFRLAIDLNVSVINFSMTAPNIEKNAIIRDIIQEALDAGIVVIGAAGNNSISATNFIPGCIDGVITIGAVDADGKKIARSNYNADYYVVADSTSEATARYTGLYTAGLADISGKVFDQVEEDDDYTPDDYLWAYDVAEELTNRLQTEQGYGYVTFYVDEDGNVWFIYHDENEDGFSIASWPQSDATIALDHDVAYAVSGTRFTGTCSFTSTNGGKGYATGFSGTLGAWLSAAGISQVPMICSKNFGEENSNHALTLPTGTMNYVATYEEGRWTIWIGERAEAGQPVWTQITDSVSYSISAGSGRYLSITVGSSTRTVDLQAPASQIVTEVQDLVRSMTVVGEYNGNKGCQVSVPNTGVGTHSATRVYWHTEDTQTYEGVITWPTETPHARVNFRKVDSETGQSLSGCVVYFVCTDGEGVGHESDLYIYDTSKVSSYSAVSWNGCSGLQFTTNGNTVAIEGLRPNSSYLFYEAQTPLNADGEPYTMASPQTSTFSTNENGDIVNVSATGDWSYSSSTATITLQNGDQPQNPDFSSISVLKSWESGYNSFFQDTQFVSFAIQFRGDWATYQEHGWGDSFSYGRIRNPSGTSAYVGWLTTRESAIAYGGTALYTGNNQYIVGRYYQHQNEAGQFVDNEGASYDWNTELLYLPYGYYHITEYWNEAYLTMEGRKEFAESANISGWTLESGGPGTGHCQYGIIIKIDGSGTWICDSNGNPVGGLPITGGVRLESVSNDTRQASLDVRKIDLTGSGVDNISFELYRGDSQVAVGYLDAINPSGTTTDAEGNTVYYYDVSWNYNYNQAWRDDASEWHYTEIELRGEPVVQHLNYDTTYQIREYITDIENYRVPDGWTGMDADKDGDYDYFYINVTLNAAYHREAMVVDCGNSLNGRIDVTKVNLTGGPLTDLSFEIRNSSNDVVATGYIPANATPETTGTGTATDYTYSAVWDFTINGTSFTGKNEAVTGLGTFEVREYIPVSAVDNRTDITVTDGWTYGGTATHNGVSCYYYTKTVMITDDNAETVQVAYATNAVTPPAPQTTMTDFADRHITVVGETIEFTDVVSYQGLYIGGSYVMHATLMDADTGLALTDENGNAYTADTVFTPTAGHGTVDVIFNVNTAHLVEATQHADGTITYSPRRVVCYEYLYLVGVGTPYGPLLASHADQNDEGQTVTVPNPEIGTQFTDLQTSEHETVSGRVVEVVDHCSFTGLHIGETYTLTCYLYDQTTGNRLVYSTGEDVVAVQSFVAEEESGTVDVTFTIDTSDLLVNYFAYEERTMVAFEYLRTANGILIGGHADLDDLEQHTTPRLPVLHTSIVDDQTGSREGRLGSAVPFTDTVSFTNVNIGETYLIRGRIVSRENPNIVYATAECEFVPQSRTGTVDVNFVVDTSMICEGSNEAYIVCFEQLWQLDTQNTGRGEVLLASHEDVTDQNQTIHLPPEVHTQMCDVVTNSNYGMIGENVEFVDTVSYYRLHIGETYTVTGVLMDKQTGMPVLDENGQTITASTTFVPTTTDGTVEVTYHLNTLRLIQQIGQTINGVTVEAPREIVSFETITSSSGYDFEIHADINDEGQTIVLGDISSGAGDIQTSTSWLAAGMTTVRDTVHYRGLGPVEYEVRGSLHLVDYDENGNPIDGGLIPARAGEVTETSYTWTPSTHEGNVNLDYRIDSTRFAGRNIIVFEELWYNGTCIISHEHYCDANGGYGMNNLEQTVRVASLHTNAYSFQTGAQMVARDTQATINDFCYYGNVEVGQNYYVEGSLWGCYTDENGYIHSSPISNEDGGQVTSAVFTATEASGVVEVQFTIDSTVLEARGFDYVVVTERLIHVGSGVCIANHSDLSDQAQTIMIPGVRTTASTDAGRTLPDGPMSDIQRVTVTDRVFYENLVCDGRSYTCVGNLQYAKTDADGNIIESGALVQNGQAVTNSVTFVPTSPNGYIDVEFSVDVSDIIAHEYNKIVVFEDLYYGPEGVIVASHADITDEDQTIDVPGTPTPTPTPPETPPKTGDESGYANYVVGAIVAITFLAAGIALLAVLDRKNNPDDKKKK